MPTNRFGSTATCSNSSRCARPPFDFAGAWFALGEQQLHLIEAPGFVAPVGQHFALFVDDIGATIEVLTERGVKVSHVAEIPGVCLQAFFADPTGNSIELNQPLARVSGTRDDGLQEILRNPLSRHADA